VYHDWHPHGHNGKELQATPKDDNMGMDMVVWYAGMTMRYGFDHKCGGGKDAMDAGNVGIIVKPGGGGNGAGNDDNVDIPNTNGGDGEDDWRISATDSVPSPPNVDDGNNDDDVDNVKDESINCGGDDDCNRGEPTPAIPIGWATVIVDDNDDDDDVVDQLVSSNVLVDGGDMARAAVFAAAAVVIDDELSLSSAITRANDSLLKPKWANVSNNCVMDASSARSASVGGADDDVNLSSPAERDRVTLDNIGCTLLRWFFFITTKLAIADICARLNCPLIRAVTAGVGVVENDDDGRPDSRIPNPPPSRDDVDIDEPPRSSPPIPPS
jgi:hypothetical protein